LRARGPGVVAEVPDAVMAELGGKRVPVVATVNGHAWRTTTAVYSGVAMIGLNKEVRTAAAWRQAIAFASRSSGTKSRPTSRCRRRWRRRSRTTSPRREVFDSLAYTHRKEFAQWIAEAKREETRERRVAKALQMLRERKTIS
jgi:predicted aminopeptidase